MNGQSPTRIEAQSICVSLSGRQVLRQISVTFSGPELVAIVGPNGSGKSTLLRTLLGLVPIDSGDVLLSGTSIRRLPRNHIARSIAYVPQDTSIDYPLSVRDVVMMGRVPHLKRFQMARHLDIEGVRTAMDTADVAHLAERPITELSSGERQRVYIARAVAQDAPCLMLDEPTSSLDIAHELQILELIKTLVSKGRCAVTVLHDMSLAARFCNRIVMLSAGQLVADGAPEVVVTPGALLKHFGVHADIQKSSDGTRLLLWPIASARRRSEESLATSTTDEKIHEERTTE